MLLEVTFENYFSQHKILDFNLVKLIEFK